MTIVPMRIKTWIIQDLWKTRARDLPQPRRTLVKLLKIALLAGRTFKNDQATKAIEEWLRSEGLALA